VGQAGIEEIFDVLQSHILPKVASHYLLSYRRPRCRIEARPHQPPDIISMRGTGFDPARPKDTGT